MTIKNKKTKQTKSSEVSSSTSASSSVQKTTSKTVQQSSSSTSLQKATSSGKKVRYIEVKVEEDDPLMITDVTDHSISGSTISEHYNSHPHYIITEAPSMTDLSQTRSIEQHQVSDMAQSNTGEFVSSSVLQESSSSHQQSSKSETIQSSSSVHRSGSSHSQIHDRTVDSSTSNQSLNTAFIDTSGGSNSKFLTRSQGANATDSFLHSERQELMNQSVQQSSQSSSQTFNTNQSSDHKNVKQHENINYRNSPEPSKRVQNVKSNSSNFYGGEGTLDKNTKTKEYSSTSQTSETKSSNVTKSSSSSYVVEIVDGKERIIDSSKREWGDASENVSREAYASVSGTDIKPQSVYSSQHSDLKSNYDTGKDGQKPTSQMVLKEQSKFIKDGNQITTHESIISEKDNYRQHQLTSTQDNLTSTQDHSTHSQGHPPGSFKQGQPSSGQGYPATSRGQPSSNQDYPASTQGKPTSKSHPTSIQGHPSSTQTHYTSTQDNITSKDQMYQSSSVTDYNTSTSTTHHTDRNVVEKVTNNQNTTDRRRNANQTDSSNFYGYDATIQNELRKVGDILQVGDTKNVNFSTKILKSNTSSAQQASTSSYVFEIVDGKQVLVDSSHREWGDSKEHGTHEKSHNVSGTGIKPESEYTRHVLDKESHYDTGKNGIPTSSTQVAEESVLYKNGKEIASTSNVYAGDFTKKKAITEHHTTDVDDVHNKRIRDTSDTNIHSTTYETTSSDIQSHSKDFTDITKSTDFVTTEKQNLEKQNITKESSSTSVSESKDTLTTYERSTGAWNGKFVYEKDDDRPRKPKDTSPFGRPEQPRHHLKRQDTEENIILSSRDIKDFTSISDLRKIIESSTHKKDVTVSNKNIVINRNIDDRVLKEIIETVKKYPFKRIDKVTFGSKINEDVKDLYEGVDTEETTVLSTTGGTTRKSFEVEKNRSQVEVTRYITENGITRKITTYEEPKEDDKIKTNVFVDKSTIDFKNLVSCFLYNLFW